MNKKLLSALIITTALTAISGLVAGAYWLVQRVAVGSVWHALGSQEWSKDIFVHGTRDACRNVNAGNIWIPRSDSRYVHDRNATSAYVYRYIVLEGNILQDANCLKAFVTAASSVSYSTSIAFSDDSGREIANFIFLKEQV